MFEHSPTLPKAPLLAALIVVTITAVLAVDRVFGVPGQIAVPLFVPPGHALLYLLGVILAERLPPTVSAIVPVLA